MRDLNKISGDIIDAAIGIHRRVGPGLFESVYEVLLAYELVRRGYTVRRQVVVPLIIDGIEFEQAFKADMVVAECVVVELKVERALSAVDRQQILTYTKLLDFRLGLLLNFGGAVLKDGIIRVVNGFIESPRP
jgi:GxxExxY protein